jgi:hypothetical protein
MNDRARGVRIIARNGKGAAVGRRRIGEEPHADVYEPMRTDDEFNRTGD